MVDNRADEALDTLAKGMIFNPDNAEYAYRLVCYHYSLGNIHESYEILASALDKNVQLCHTLFEYTPALEMELFRRP